MKSIIWLALLGVFAAGAATAGEDGVAQTSGIFVGDPPQQLCDLATAPALLLPELPETAGLPTTGTREGMFSVRISPQLRSEGLLVRDLRLLRLHPADGSAKVKLVSIAVDSDTQDHDLWHVHTGAALAEGVYDFALERPGWEAGLGKSDHVLFFLSCHFVVEARPADASTPEEAVE